MHSLRNIAIIAHVDHGKTTLVDQLLRQSGTFAAHQKVSDRVMDSNELEKERGITITSKNCAIEWQDYRINIVDTPGHADFGGEVERALSLVDGVLLLVDAVDGPMPQTRFVTQKALAAGLSPIVVVNKVDRPEARIDYVINQTFDLFADLGANDDQLDFFTIYCSALQGYASSNAEQLGDNMTPLFQAIVEHIPAPQVELDKPLQMQVSTIGYSSYTGRVGIGQIRQGRIKLGDKVRLLYKDIDQVIKPGQIMGFHGLEQVKINEAQAGDIVALTGIENVAIGATICDPEHANPLPLIDIDEPTLSMYFRVNTSPFAGREGKFVTSRNIRERLNLELKTNVALRVEDTADTDIFLVSGRGELHLTILLENLRREGFELAVSKPKVIMKEIDGKLHEPVESLTIDVDQEFSGAVIEELGRRKGELLSMEASSASLTRLTYKIPARGLTGWQTTFMNLTRGTGLMGHVFDSFEPHRGSLPSRSNGVLVSQFDGDAVAYSLEKLQSRGRMFVSPGDKVYEGMIIGIHSRDNDLTVNVIRAKQLTNFRASGKDDTVPLVTPIPLTLEYAIEFIEDDELVEITPKSIRIRKLWLKENERKKSSRPVDA